MNRVGKPPIELDQVLQITLMGAALDFAVAFEKKDMRNMKAIYQSVAAMAVAAPGFIGEVKRMQNLAFSQIQQDLAGARAGTGFVTPPPEGVEP